MPQLPILNLFCWKWKSFFIHINIGAGIIILLFRTIFLLFEGS